MEWYAWNSLVKVFNSSDIRNARAPNTNPPHLKVFWRTMFDGWVKASGIAASDLRHRKNREDDNAGRGWRNLHIGSPRGWKRTSFTVPLCPGSLFRSFPVRVSQIATLWSPLPAAIFSPVESQLAFRRFRSCPVGAPSYVCMRRSAGANGRTSHVLTVESCAFDSRVWLSGDI
jgi:hypothetical protein